LVIVPDGALHALPFAALVDAESGQFLVERHELTIAPSATDFLREQDRLRSRRQPPTHALVLGDPRVDPLLFPGFASLAGARQEAEAVAGLYPRRELLLGAAATRGAFLELVGRREVVHFSGHAVPNRIDPSAASLPLAGDPGGAGGLLVAAEIARLDLTDTRTVVLSGCETGVGADGGAGPLSLARSFLAAGAPNVVASLWPIADAPSAPLMTAFHRRLRGGEQPAAALRGAQLELLRGKQPLLASPTVWAAFAAFGG
jgi:CHAT domain-containing protein